MILRVIKVRLFLYGKRSSNFGALDLLANHVAAQASLPSHKAGMVVGALVLAMTETRKAIKIQLALKGGVLGLIKVNGHDADHKFLGIVHHEGPTVRLPTNHRVIVGLGHVVQHLVEFPRKGSRDSALGNGLVQIFL